MAIPFFTSSSLQMAVQKLSSRIEKVSSHGPSERQANRDSGPLGETYFSLPLLELTLETVFHSN